MTLFDLEIFTALIMLPGCCIAAIRYPAITSPGKPFIYFFCLGFLNELVSLYLIKIKLTQYSNINGNIYVLIEFLLLLWLFRNWGKQMHSARSYILLAFLVIATWLADNVIFHQLTTFNGLYRIAYSLILVFLSTDLLNYVLLTARKYWRTDARFIASLGLLIFFIYKLLYEILYYWNLPFTQQFHEKLYLIFLLINLVCNILYTLVILWLPTKQRFYIPYSA